MAESSMGLDSVEFVMELEDEFCIHIADADAEQMHTIGAVVHNLSARPDVMVRIAEGQERVDAIRRRVNEMVAEFMRVDVATLSDDTHFVDDLEMD